MQPAKARAFEFAQGDQRDIAGAGQHGAGGDCSVTARPQGKRHEIAVRIGGGLGRDHPEQ
ncbi:hypothetical protein ACFSTD_11140 [Novosphingobium colocasiae]